MSLHNVSKSYRSANQCIQAVHAVSLDIARGDIHGIIGPSGSGKSTLLRMMNVLERPDAGNVLVDGADLTLMTNRQLQGARRSMGMIFQHFHLLSNKTVGGNVSIPLELAGVSKRERLERVDYYLQVVGLQDKADQYPTQLSGGQKQRVAIARALANRPKVLLCDEPTSSLDPQTTAGILEVLKHINDSLGLTIVIVTHEMEVVQTICSKVSVMEAGNLIHTLAIEVPHV